MRMWYGPNRFRKPKLENFRPRKIQELVNRQLADSRYGKYRKAVESVLIPKPDEDQQKKFESIADYFASKESRPEDTPRLRKRLTPIISKLLLSHPVEKVRKAASLLLQAMAEHTAHPSAIRALRKSAVADPSKIVKAASGYVMYLPHPNRKEQKISEAIVSKELNRQGNAMVRSAEARWKKLLAGRIPTAQVNREVADRMEEERNLGTIDRSYYLEFENTTKRAFRKLVRTGALTPERIARYIKELNEIK